MLRVDSAIAASIARPLRFQEEDIKQPAEAVTKSSAMEIQLAEVDTLELLADLTLLSLCNPYSVTLNDCKTLHRENSTAPQSS